MNIKNISRQLSTGAVAGLSCIVYAISHGALLFSGDESDFLALGMTVALTTAVIFALGSCFFKEKTFVMGTESGVVAVMASSLITVDILSMPGEIAQATILAIFFSLAVVASLIFYLVARFNLSNYVRYIPFSVMAGLLAATGWLICAAALKIISGLSLSMVGLESFVKDPMHPELFAGFVVAFIILGLAKKVSTAILMPLVIILSALAVHLFLNSPLCANREAFCSDSTWLFMLNEQSSWTPVWQIEFANIDFNTLAHKLPSMLVVTFVALITILLKVAGLELSFKKEFDFNQALRVHAGSSVVSGILGGFFGVILTATTVLNKSGGGGRMSSIVAAALCFLMLLGGGEFLTFLPRVALGGVILYLGLVMLKNWAWDQRKVLNKGELIEIGLILITVANFGYIAGFGMGVAIACISFVIACSKSPLISLQTDSSSFSSSVVRHEYQRQIIDTYGNQSLIFKLNGHIFFGSASNIELIFDESEKRNIKNILLDFTDVIAIDRSAVGVFQRILRREKLSHVHFYFIYSEHNKDIVFSLAPQDVSELKVSFYSRLDFGVEAMEESIIKENESLDISLNPFDFIESLDEKNILIEHCQLKSFDVGQILCKQGDDSNQIYFLKKGALEIVKEAGDSHIRLTKLSDGAMVGEMAFYSGNLRSATIRASSASEVYVLDGESLTKLRHTHPQLANQLDVFVIRKLASALTRTNKLIGSLH